MIGLNLALSNLTPGYRSGGGGGGSWVDPDITNLSYTGESFDCSINSANSSGIRFSLDGMKMFLFNNFVSEYALPAPYDIANAVFTANSISLFISLFAGGGVFGIGGTKMWAVFVTGSATRRVYEYNLSAPYDVTTLTVSTDETITGMPANFSRDIYSKEDGSRQWVLNSTVTSQYDLVTPPDLIGGNTNYSQLSPSAEGITMNPDRTKAYLALEGTTTLTERDMPTPFDITGWTIGATFTDLTYPGTSIKGAEWNDLGTELFIIDNQTNRVYKYTTLPFYTGTMIAGNDAINIGFDTNSALGSMNPLPSNSPAGAFDWASLYDIIASTTFFVGFSPSNMGDNDTAWRRLLITGITNPGFTPIDLLRANRNSYTANSSGRTFYGFTLEPLFIAGDSYKVELFQ